MTILAVKDISISFGGVLALDSINLEVEEVEIRGIIGPNGAGKTTLLNIIGGYCCPDKGEVYFREQDLLRLHPYQIARLGIGRTFQLLALFPEMTVLENVSLALYSHVKMGLFSSIFKPKSKAVVETKLKSNAIEILDLLGIADLRDQISSTLPYGQQRLLELARCLALQPSLLLLDEPAAGMNLDEVKRLSKIIQFARDSLGITIVLVEHVMRLVMAVSDKISVFHYGQKIAEGTPEIIKNEPQVIRAYLGERRRYVESERPPGLLR